MRDNSVVLVLIVYVSSVTDVGIDAESCGMRYEIKIKIVDERVGWKTTKL